MNNAIKLLLFNSLLIASSATEAMNTFRGLGSRASKTAFEAATKFKVNAQAFKVIQQPLLKSFNFKDGQRNYKTSARMVAMMPLMSAGFIYGTYDRLKTSLGYMPPLTAENIDQYQHYKEQVFERKLPAAAVKALMLKYPEHAEKYAVCQYYMYCKATYPDDPIIIPYELDNPDLQAAFADIKIKMGIAWSMPLIEDASLSGDYSASTRYTNTKTPFFYVVIHPQAQLTDAWKHVVAHETAHLAMHHIEKGHFLCDRATPEGLALARQFEYEADEKAALTLGSIQGGMEFLGAIPDANSAFDWKLPNDNIFHTNFGLRVLDESRMTHPSNANRCRALLALVKKYPEKFSQSEKIKGKTS